MVGQCVDPVVGLVVDQAETHLDEPAVDRRVSPAEGPMRSLAASRALSPMANRVVVPAIGTSAVRRNVRPVVGQVGGPMVGRAVSPVDKALVKVAPLAVADQVRDGPPMIVRNAQPVRWVRPSPKKSTSPNSTQLF